MFVGDENQAIFGFTGADCDSMDIIKRDFDCVPFPMMVTRRCSKAVVRLAQSIVPEYRAHEDNIEGSVTAISEKDFLEKIVFVPGEDAVICRNTAPLVKTAYKLIARGVPAHVEGRDIGSKLIKFVERFRKARNMVGLRDQMQAYLEKQTKKLTEKKDDSKLGELVDQIDTITAIMETIPENASMDDLIYDINNLFADTTPGEKCKTVALMTAHRSKGREFRRVFGWNNAGLFPSKYAKLDWQKKQEKHLLYVLWTRTLEDYVDVETME